MKNNFIKAMQSAPNTKTFNDAPTHSSANSSLVDMFSMGGSLRTRTDEEVRLMIRNTLNEDLAFGVVLLFHLRDIRGGQGERRLFRLFLDELYTQHPQTFKKVFSFVPEYGRWDDLIEEKFFKDKKVLDFIKFQLEIDKENLVKNQPVSLLGKWLPSINTSNSRVRQKALKLSKLLSYTKADYRKLLSSLRKALNVIEVTLTTGDWNDIKFESVPSQAMLKYRKAFYKNVEEKFKAYIEKVEEGDAKINTATLYPSQIIANYRNASQSKFEINELDSSLEAIWENLPDFVGAENSICVCDTSGSMMTGNGSCIPLDVSLGLTIYFAERNKNKTWKNHFITFSEDPSFQEIKGATLKDKINNLSKAEWGFNTDLFKVFNLILDQAKKFNLQQEQLPETIYIISDMEFDVAMDDKTNFEAIEELFSSNGYKRPKLIFWNVNSMQNNVPVKEDENGTILVSGSSPVVFKFMAESEETTPRGFMLEVLNSKRYEPIREALGI